MDKLASPAIKILTFLVILSLIVFMTSRLAHREMEITGCGPRALYAAMTVMGSNVTEAQVIGQFYSGGQSVIFSEMGSVARRLGFAADAHQMTLTELCRNKPVGVLHVDQTHFVALIGYISDGVLIVDPLYKGSQFRKPVQWLYSDLEARWDGKILIIKPLPGKQRARR